MTKNKDEIIYGLHAVRHALEQAPEQVLELWVQQHKKSSPELNNIYQLADAVSIVVQSVLRATLNKHTGNAVHQGVAIRRRVVKQKQSTDLDSILSLDRESIPMFLILDGIQDPHNLGACIRTANVAGVDAVIIPKHRAVPVNATVRKVASGAAEHTPCLTVTNIARSIRKLQQTGIWVIGAAEDADTSLYDTDLTLPLALVLGAEGKGIRQNIRKHCDKLVHIPSSATVASLNVSVAAGVCLFEIMRQRLVNS